MSEAAFQSKLINRYEKAGWYVIKLIQTNRNGVGDLLLLPSTELRTQGNEPFFIEAKATHGRVSPLQIYRHKEIKEKTGYDTIVMIEP